MHRNMEAQDKLLADPEGRKDLFKILGSRGPRVHLNDELYGELEYKVRLFKPINHS